MCDLATKLAADVPEMKSYKICLIVAADKINIGWKSHFESNSSFDF